MPVKELSVGLCDGKINYHGVRQLVIKHVQRVNSESTPGYPLRHVCNNNAKVLLSPEWANVVIDCAVYRLLVLLSADQETLDQFSNDPRTAVRCGMADPIVVFNKNKPHPARKLAEKRFRIINARSLIDQVVIKTLMDDYCDLMVQSFPGVPTLMGMGTSDEQTECIGKVYEANCALYGVARSSDVSKWDGSFPVHGAMSGVRVLNSQFEVPGGKSKDSWKRALEAYSLMMCNPLYVLPDGQLLYKHSRGQMPSGDYLTTIFNSICRRVLAKLAGSDQEMNLGDDCIEWSKCDNATERYAEMGVNIRDVKYHGPSEFEFCSHHYRKENGKWTASLISWIKMVYASLIKKPSLDVLMGTGYEMRHNPVEDKLKWMSVNLSRLVETPVPAAGQKN